MWQIASPPAEQANPPPEDSHWRSPIRVSTDATRDELACPNPSHSRRASAFPRSSAADLARPIDGDAGAPATLTYSGRGLTVSVWTVRLTVLRAASKACAWSAWTPLPWLARNLRRSSQELGRMDCHAAASAGEAILSAPRSR